MSNSLVLRAVLLFLGAVILLCWIVYRLVPRANYVSSSPQPGAVLSVPPETIDIKFNNELSNNSEISVASTITVTPSGELSYGDGKTFRSAKPDPHDPERKTLRIYLDPGLAKGLYWVKWKTTAAWSGAQRYGQFCFSVGMPVPDHIIRDEPGGFLERESRFRDYRAMLMGGITLLALGIALPYLPRRG